MSGSLASAASGRRRLRLCVRSGTHDKTLDAAVTRGGWSFRHRLLIKSGRWESGLPPPERTYRRLPRKKGCPHDIACVRDQRSGRGLRCSPRLYPRTTQRCLERQRWSSDCICCPRRSRVFRHHHGQSHRPPGPANFCAKARSSYQCQGALTRSLVALRELANRLQIPLSMAKAGGRRCKF